VASRCRNLPVITIEDGYCIPTGTAGDATRLRSKILAMASDGCWIWDGCQVMPNPLFPDYKYGRCYGPKSKCDERFVSGAYAHRAAYIVFKGDIPDGMTVDHVCFNPLCVNPDHLQLLTRSENAARKNPATRPITIAKFRATRERNRLAREHEVATRGQSAPGEE
jgi:hypothetical protein